MGKGWISLHRRIQNHWLWEEKPFSRGQAWVDLLLLVNHADNKILFNNDFKTIKRGQRIISMQQLQDRWGWSNTKVKNFLALLEKDKMISLEIAPRKYTLVTIENYNNYQDDDNKKHHESTTQTPQNNHESTTEQSQKHINNNDNNDNNDNNMLLSLYSEKNTETQNCPQTCPQGCPQDTFPNFYKWVDEKGYAAEAKYPNEEPYYLKYLHEKANFISKTKGKEHPETIRAIKAFEDRKVIASEEDKEKAQEIGEK